MFARQISHSASAYHGYLFYVLMLVGIIRECGGKMFMSQKEWESAQTDFFEAFKNYDEAGSPQRINCLKYLVLANMLMESQINPFDSQETKPYKNDPQILAMTNLVSAFQRKEIREFESILRENQASIMGDPFIKRHIDQVLKNIRSQVLIKMVQPYTRIELSFLAQVSLQSRAQAMKQLNIPLQDVEDILVGLILDKRILGRIDQVNARLEPNPEYVYPWLTFSTTNAAQMATFRQLAVNVNHLFTACVGKVS